jgi:hypothetical protein
MKDLKSERRLVYLKLKKYHIEPIWAEDFNDNLETSEKIIEDKFLDIDGYLGIFDRRYGFRPKENNPDEISVSNIEFNIARKFNLPMLIFVSRIKEDEKRDPDDKDYKFEEFLEMVGDYNNGRWMNFYDDYEEFKDNLEKKISDFSNDLENEGLPKYLRPGIIKNPMNLSINHRKSEWYLKESNNEYLIVIPETFEVLRSYILDLIQKGKSIIIKGRHGIGKSVFTRLMILQDLQKLPAFLDSNRIRIEDLTQDDMDILNVKKVYFLIDPIDPLTYKDRQQFSGNLFRNLKDNVGQNINELIQNKIKFVGILPTDKWNEIETELGNLNIKEIKLKDLDFNSVDDMDIAVCDFNDILRESCFIKKVIESHSNRDNTDLHLDVIVDKILKFNDGQPLLASYVGRFLDNGYEPKSIEEILDQASSQVTKFFLSYVWLVKLRKDSKTIHGKMFGIIARLLLGSMPAKLIEDLPSLLESANLQPNEYEFNQWLSELNDDLVLKSLRDIIIKSQDDPDTKEYPVIINSIRFVIEKIMDTNELKNYHLLEDKIIVMIQTHLKQKILLLNNDAKTSLARLYANYLMNRSYIMKDNDQIFSYFTTKETISDYSHKILFGKPGYIPDILNFSIVLKNIDEVNDNLMYKEKKVGELNEVLTHIVFASIAENINVEIISRSLKGILILLQTYMRYFIEYYVTIGNRLITRLDITDSKQVAILLNYINELMNIDKSVLDLILRNINIREIVTEVSIVADPIASIFLYRFLLFYYNHTNDDINYEQTQSSAEERISNYPYSGPILDIHTLDLRLDHSIKKGLKLEHSFISEYEHKIRNLRNSRPNCVLDQFISSITLIEDDPNVKSTWLTRRETSIKQMYLRYLMAQNKLEEYISKMLEYKEIFKDEYRAALLQDLISILKNNQSNKLFILNKEIELKKLLSYNKEFIKYVVSLNIIMLDLNQGKECYLTLNQIFNRLDFSNLFIFGYYSIRDKDIINVRSEEWFKQHLAIYSHEKQNHRAVEGIDDIFVKYQDISKNIFTSLKGIILFLIYLFLYKEFDTIQNILDLIPKIYIQPILAEPIKEYKNGSLKEMNRFLTFIRKFYVVISLPELMF